MFSSFFLHITSFVFSFIGFKYISISKSIYNDEEYDKFLKQASLGYIVVELPSFSIILGFDNLLLLKFNIISNLYVFVSDSYS